MREQQPSIRFMEQGYRILVCSGTIGAAVDLAQDFSVLQQQTPCAQSFVNHRKAAIARCRRRVKVVGILSRRALFLAVKCERTPAAHPIDQFVAAPTKGPDAGCRKAVLPERNHPRIVAHSSAHVNVRCGTRAEEELRRQEGPAASVSPAATDQAPTAPLNYVPCTKHEGDDIGYSYCAAIARSNKFRMAAWPSASFTWVRLVAPITGLMATIATSFARSRSPVN